MKEQKTKPTDKSVKKFLNNVENKRRIEDSFMIFKLMQEVHQEDSVMWVTVS